MENALKIKEDVLLLSKEIDGLKGKNTIALDLSNDCSWTGYFIITTCSSNAHLRGVLEEIRKQVYAMGYTIKQNRKNHGAKGWVLMDCGDFILHLFVEEQRDYYQIEERWENAEVIYSSSKLS